MCINGTTITCTAPSAGVICSQDHITAAIRFQSVAVRISAALSKIAMVSELTPPPSDLCHCSSAVMGQFL